MRVVLAFVIAPCLLFAACGGAGATPTSSPSPSPSRFFTVIPTPTPSPPSPSALVSARGSIGVRQPLANTRVSSPLTISGDASVFEAALSWRITDTAGRVVVQGNATASAGAPARGTFSLTAFYTDPPADAPGFVEVFDRSPRDGSIDEMVRVPVTLASR